MEFMTAASNLPDASGEEAALPRESASRESFAGPDPVISSAQLLQGRKTVQIEHNGALYLLRTTRLGKLILTK